MSEENAIQKAEEVAPGGSFIEAITALATNPNVDADKVQKFMNMQERVLDRNAEQQFNEAMMSVQRAMPVIARDADNQQTRSKYSRLETVIKRAAPIYTEAGFSLSFYEGDAPREGYIRIMADVMHRAGHTKVRWVDLPVDDRGIKGTTNKTQTHANGSTLSYGRRYLACMIFNIPTGDDDDGNGNSGSYQTISEAQSLQIAEMLQETNSDVGIFLGLFQIDKVADMPAAHFPRAIELLNKKKAKVAS